MTEQEKFIMAYGGIYEHSPWVARQVWQSGDITNLADAMQAVVDGATRDRKLALLRAHPDLAGRAAVAGDLSEHSTLEQQGAGLDQCSAEEFQELQALNRAYRAKFDFPFIVAVRGMDRFDILENFRARMENSVEDEFITALKEVHKIARLRLAAITEEQNFDVSP